MANYEHKAKILGLGLNKQVGKLDKRLKSLINENIENAIDVPYEEMIFCNEHHCTPNDIQEARLINSASYKRMTRLKDRIRQYLLSGQCIWLTLTFSDDTLSKTSEETRRKYVSRFLKSQSNCYIANIDYGSQNEREHYHAVVVGDFVDMKPWKKYGFALTERIKNHDKTPVKLAKYVSKLTNHAIKETTRRCCYIYSR